MSSFTYPRPGNKSTVYVGNSKYSFKPFTIPGGLPDHVDEEGLRAALLPFGEIIDVLIPRDTTIGNTGRWILCMQIFY